VCVTRNQSTATELCLTCNLHRTTHDTTKGIKIHQVHDKYKDEIHCSRYVVKICDHIMISVALEQF